MKKLVLLLLAALAALVTAAQQPENQSFPCDFTSVQTPAGTQFKPQLPPLSQKAGAPATFYSYLWEFGDGNFSRAENPLYAYPTDGEYEVNLSAIAHYDDSSNPKRKKQKSPQKKSAVASVGRADFLDVFENGRQAIALRANAEPRPGDEITLILSYRNLRPTTTDGQLFLFFNENKFPARHFDFIESRTHFGEAALERFSAVTSEPGAFGWAGSADFQPKNDADFPPQNLAHLLDKNRDGYRDERAWTFAALAPGEKRNLFASLTCTPAMLKDTSAFVRLTGIFAPSDPGALAEEFVLEIEIVNSHDPNAIAVSDVRVNYRFLDRKNLEYKVRFQNNGEGPASRVELTVQTPPGLNLGKMRPLRWYPECPICPKTPTTKSCLDTASVAGRLIFTFKNIHLPGSRQKGMDYDSTKGFVSYRIEPQDDMPKRSFRSRASIVFDKNPPIFTNFSRTRFKPGLSPGLKAGYGFDPAAADSGYLFLGASLSPFKSWRVYPQVELLTGFRSRLELPETLDTGRYIIENPVDFIRDSVWRVARSGSRGFVSLELPVLLRKNFSRFFGLGLGGSARLIFENGEDRTEGFYRLRRGFASVDANGVVHWKTEVYKEDKIPLQTQSYSARRMEFAVFGDLTLGLVRLGPNLGVRGGYVFSGGKRRPFVQVSAEVKL